MIRRRCLDALEARLSICTLVPLLFWIGSAIHDIDDFFKNNPWVKRSS